MSASPHEPNVTNADGLFCPECDYNLTGSVESRCAECGLPFDVAELRDLMRSTSRAIRWSHLFLQLAVPTGLFILGIWASARTSQEWFFATVWITATIATPLVTMDATDRFFSGVAQRRGTSPYSKIRTARWLMLWGTLLVLQATTGCLGAYAAAMQVYRRG
jgi:hypothetical protein